VASNLPLPSRLLDLEGCSNRNEIRLQETGGLHGHYAALSHSWGRIGHFTTSRASIAARKEGIEIKELPKTFQDAMEIARRMGIRYLWIDSLCICQDDVEEWARQSAEMAAIYSNAYLTIAAAHTEDNSGGCFNRPSRRRHVPIQFTAPDSTSGQLLAFLLPSGKEALSQFYLELSSEPLTKRAWALQERLMAQRILHYCADQMYYECDHEFVSEDGFRAPGRYCHLFQAADSLQVVRRSKYSADLALWGHLLSDYGHRRLSKPSDKLPAMSGLARMFEKRMQASYVAGLWSNALIEGLAWQGLQSTKDPATPALQSYIAPSWSWASYSGVAATSIGQSWRDVAKVLDHHVELKTSNPYGELKDGWIMISAPLVPLSMSGEPEEDEAKVPHKRNIRLKTPRGSPFGSYANFDNIDSRDEGADDYVKSLELFALVLRRHEPDEGAEEKKEENDDTPEDVIGKDPESDKNSEADESSSFYIALIVVQVATSSSESPRMQRLGWIFLDPEISEDGRNVFEDPSTFQTVVLV
jgi:Heterokaryon incompatibility protein (HET)